MRCNIDRDEVMVYYVVKRCNITGQNGHKMNWAQYYFVRIVERLFWFTNEWLEKKCKDVC